jgi:glycosyltransferase involved in cell wall biosynthesis
VAIPAVNILNLKPPLRIVIADPGLMSRSGHHYPYTEAVSRAANAAGIRTLVWGHKQISPRIAEPLKAKPVFRVGPYGGFFGASCSIGRCLYSNAITAEDLKGAPDPVGPDDLVFFHTVSDDQLIAIATWLAEIPEQARPRVEVLLRFHPEVHPDPKSRLASYAIGMGALALLSGWVSFSTDTERLSAWFERNNGIFCRVVPIPHLPRMHAAEDNKAAVPVVAYIGDARADKGFTLLPALASLLLERKTPVRLLVQAGGTTLGPAESEVADQLDRMPEIAKVVRGSLRTAEYHKLFTRASIILLPYEQARYAYGTSGVFAEAMAAGKPTITTADTWMTDEARRLGGAVYGLERPDVQSLAHAIETMLKDLAGLQLRAQQAAAAWGAEHNEQKLLECLLTGKGLATRETLP